uniref:Uncharacterized protein n=1 Tax=Haptolina ericina TaxID=156174 RepID=A0A7S3ABR8_9EUKA|mmetsp:Transcript_10886/g.25074  ORF Transcript_10886/g.25074 Transcript_10886/m.25074 type:complete len:106 (+) Transcript_10886:171-488(+)
MWYRHGTGSAWLVQAWYTHGRTQVCPCAGALLIALTFIGAVEAGALMEIGVHHRACCSEPPTSSPTTQIAVLVDFKGKIIALSRVSVNSAELLTCRARLSHGFLC